MITLIYGSTATKLMSSEELVDLLEVARHNNERNNITGMLLYSDGNFLQVLEGEEDAVKEVFSKIQKDPRHHSVMAFIKYPITKRLFDEWEMGFVNADGIGANNIPGYTGYLNDPDHNEKMSEPSYAQTFLSIFRENIR